MSAILNPLYFAVSWVMVGFHKIFGYIFGATSHESAKWVLSIISLVILIRILLIPVFVKQIKAQRMMQVLQPKVKDIQKRFKDDRQKQTQEIMKLYKDHNTSQFASCLPLFLQMPFFFSLFTVLNGIARNKPHGFMRGAELKSAQTAHFFGVSISDNFTNTHGLHGKVVTFILILLMGGAQFVTQKQVMTKGMVVDTSNGMMMQQQKIMMYVLPVIIAVTGVKFPVGVLIYWTISNSWALGQQIYVIKRNPTPGSPAYKEWEQKQAAKTGGSINSTPTTNEGSIETEQGGQRIQPRRNGKKKPKKS